MKIKIGDTVIATKNNIRKTDLYNKRGLVTQVSSQGSFDYLVLFEDGHELWSDAVPFTKLHKLLYGIK
jgi:hypothetical protein